MKKMEKVKALEQITDAALGALEFYSKKNNNKKFLEFGEDAWLFLNNHLKHHLKNALPSRKYAILMKRYKERYEKIIIKRAKEKGWCVPNSYFLDCI